MENAEINKFLKFLAFKYSQVIVQSRLGGLIYTKCNQQGTDWVSFGTKMESKVKKNENNSKNQQQRINRLPQNVFIMDVKNMRKCLIIY